jgi:multidrug efflux pump subunit AcrB
MAMTQMTAVAQNSTRQMPPGTTPPFLIVYSASSVPILQLALSGEGLSEQQLFDFGTTNIRTSLATVQGASVPNPYGGKQRQIVVDLDQAAMLSKGLSPSDVVSAIANQNQIIPAGTSKIGQYEYDISLNANPKTIQELNDLPIKAVGNSTIYVRDVAHVRDGFSPQTNIVRRDGQRSTLITIMKTGTTSTLDIVKQVRDKLPQTVAVRPRLR